MSHPERMSRLQEKLVIQDPELRTFILTVIQHNLYQESRKKGYDQEWTRNLYVLYLYLFTQLTEEEIGARLTNKTTGEKTVTKQRVYQIIDKTLTVLWNRYNTHLDPDAPKTMFPYKNIRSEPRLKY
jgi:hypothetical protein